MSNEYLVKVLIYGFLLLLCGEPVSSNGADTVVTYSEIKSGDESISKESESFREPEELLDAFLANEIPALCEDEKVTIMWSDLDYEDYEIYSVGERADLDNDGEDEQIINGPYGGMYLDARNNKVYILAEGAGMSNWLSYTYYDNAAWIVHSDTEHAGRKMYWLTKYDGDGNITDEFQLSAEYWDSPGGYDESSIFTYRNEEISMAEYEALRKEIMGY